MRRLLVFTLMLSLILCGCGADKTLENTAPSTTQAPTTVPAETTAPTQDVTVPTEPEDVEDPPAPVEPAYRHPLTGEALDAPFTGRPLAFSIGNTIAALPQHGISKADLFFEIEAEGDITRFLAVITDLEAVPAIGPIRSARTFFNSVALSCNAPIVHCGGSNRGIAGYHDLTGSKISGWQHFDQFTYGNTYFYRDQSRKSSGYAQEHTLFTTGETMCKALTDKKYQSSEPWDLGLRFADKINPEGDTATELTVHFLGGKTSDFAYDAATGLYSIRQYNRDLIDGNTKKQLTFRNLFVLYADQTKRKGGSYIRSYYDLIGEGEGYFAVDGKVVKICWSREDVNAPFVFTYADGTPVTLGVGQTYIAISSTKAKTLSYE